MMPLMGENHDLAKATGFDIFCLQEVTKVGTIPNLADIGVFPHPLSTMMKHQKWQSPFDELIKITKKLKILFFSFYAKKPLPSHFPTS